MSGESVYLTKPWLANYDKKVPEYIEYEELLLYDFLKRSAAEFPESPALNFQGYKINFKKFKEMVDTFAGFLNSIGIKKGDSVSILLPNVIPCVIAYYAIMRIGAICVMNNPLYSDRELEHQFNDSDSKVLITLDLLANRMIELRNKTKIKQIIYTSIGDYLPFPKNFLFPLVGKKKGLAASVNKADNLDKWKDILSESYPAAPDAKLSFEDIAMYQYTGGTTGASKGAELTHGNVSKNIQQSAAWFNEFGRGEHIMLGALPFFHVFGLTCCMNFAVYMAWENVLVPKPQPDPLLEAIVKYKPSFTPLVPTMYIGLIEHPDIEKYDLSFIKGCFSASASLPLNVLETFEKKTGATIVEGYGLSETAPVVHLNPFAKGKRKIGSIGLPALDTITRVVDLADGETDVPIGENGELVIKGPQVMRGYVNKPEETANVLKDGWFFTGDIGYMDKDGYFFIVGRKKNMIISGGLNVYPRDIEEVYFKHPKISEVAAVGIPHKTRGEAVKLFVVLKKGEKAASEELIKYAEDKLAKYKWPVEVEFMTELPKTNVGKVLKRALRKKEG
ncbi:MAG: long-chain fatty acid--CoA ligase [Deltaproteobacteria bacterium]|nr:long-chain fatty acid--CoA ligase [Deltaproteobacteria bacterium]